MMWMEDEEEQELVKNAGCSGGLNEDPENPETGVYFSISDPCKLGWFLDINTEISEPVVNDDGTRTYDVTATYSNVLSNSDKVNAGNYILGSYGGTITGYIHIFAPAGGTISDIKQAMVEECIQVLTMTLMLHICLATQLLLVQVLLLLTK